MKNCRVLLLLVILPIVLSGCSEEQNETISDNLSPQNENVIVTDKTMQTIQQSKNMERILQDSVDQKAKELDKY